MKRLPIKKIIPYLIIVLVLIPSVSDAQRYKKSIRNPERELFGKSLNNKTVKYKEAPSIVKAKKKQAAIKKKQDKEYAAYVKSQRKHNLKIQSPEVQARMEDNRKESDLNYKEKKKMDKESARKAGKKYK
jgi:hypothetical protein